MKDKPTLIPSQERGWDIREEEPVVSISVITYNHAPYIRECLDGILMQQTKFPYELLLHDDASTDGTAEICQEYAEQYPHIILPILQKENQYSQGIMVSSTYQFPRVRGKYFAACEGDDYWTDSFKLQKQVEFLEAHTDFSMCFHNVNVTYDDARKSHLFYSDKRSKGSIDMYTPQAVSRLEELARGNFIQTPSVVVRNLCQFDNHELFKTLSICDWTVWLLTARYGKIKYMPDVMACYRVHCGGIYSKIPLVNRKLKSLLQYPPLIQTDAFDERVRSVFWEDFYRLLGEWIELCVREDAVDEVPAAFEKVAELGMTGYEKDVLLDMATRKVRTEKAREIQEGGLAFRVARKLTGTLRKK
jgi:glycosyltransferase involved in cell wall biosynthesis